jgi:hypothetical protein
VERDGRETALTETARELLREEDVLELRVPVGRARAVAPLALQVVDVEPREPLGGKARCLNDSGVALDQPIEEQVRQQEPGEVVHLERQLEPVAGERALSKIPPALFASTSMRG